MKGHHVFMGVLQGFLISPVISAIIIFLAAKLFGEKEGFGTAILVPLIGAVIFGLISYLFGVGWIASLIGGLLGVLRSTDYMIC